MSVLLWILLYLLVGFQHARLWTRHELHRNGNYSENLVPPIWIMGLPLWPLFDLIHIGVLFCRNFPKAAKRLVVAAPPRSEKKQLKRKELEARVSQLERELELDS